MTAGPIIGLGSFSAQEGLVERALDEISALAETVVAEEDARHGIEPIRDADNPGRITLI